MLQIELQNVPLVSKKNRMRIVRGRLIKSREVQDFEAEVAKAAAEVVAQLPQWKPLCGELRVTMEVQFPDKRRRDLHNLFDTTLDALQGIVYNDDVQVFEVIGRKTIGKSWSMVITIEELL